MSEQGTGAQELADEGQSHENHTVAETVGDTVNE